MGHGNKMCLDAAEGKEAELTVYWCHNKGGTQFWEYDDGFLRKDDYCVEYEAPKLLLKRCKDRRRGNRVRNKDCSILCTFLLSLFPDVDIQAQH